MLRKLKFIYFSNSTHHRINSIPVQLKPNKHTNQRNIFEKKITQDERAPQKTSFFEAPSARRSNFAFIYKKNRPPLGVRGPFISGVTSCAHCRPLTNLT